MMAHYDFEDLIKDMVSQADDLFPKDINEKEKKTTIELIYNYSNLAKDALLKEYFLTDEQRIFIIQLIAEWMYHKSIDLIRAGIDTENKEKILQHLAFTIYDVAKDAIRKQWEETRTIQTAERLVNKEYQQELTILLENKQINKEKYENAIKESNIDKLTEEKNKETEISDKEINITAEYSWMQLVVLTLMLLFIVYKITEFLLSFILGL